MPVSFQRAAIKAALDGHMQQLFGDGMRWFCTIIATIGIAFLIYMRQTNEPVEAYFPIHLKGESAFYAVLLSAVVFGAIGLLNWIVWLKKRRG